MLQDSNVVYTFDVLSSKYLHFVSCYSLERYKRLYFSLFGQAIPLFVLSKRHTPSPDVLCNQGVDVVRRVRGRLRVVPKLGGRRWPEGCVAVALRFGDVLLFDNVLLATC